MKQSEEFRLETFCIPIPNTFSKLRNELNAYFLQARYFGKFHFNTPQCWLFNVLFS